MVLTTESLAFTTSDWLNENPEFRGFKVYQHDHANGGLYNPVELGGPGYVFNGVSALLQLANQNKHK